MGISVFSQFSCWTWIFTIFPDFLIASTASSWYQLSNDFPLHEINRSPVLSKFSCLAEHLLIIIGRLNSLPPFIEISNPFKFFWISISISSLDFEPRFRASISSFDFEIWLRVSNSNFWFQVSNSSFDFEFRCLVSNSSLGFRFQKLQFEARIPKSKSKLEIQSFEFWFRVLISSFNFEFRIWISSLDFEFWF